MRIRLTSKNCVRGEKSPVKKAGLPFYSWQSHFCFILPEKIGGLSYFTSSLKLKGTSQPELFTFLFYSKRSFQIDPGKGLRCCISKRAQVILMVLVHGPRDGQQEGRPGSVFQEDSHSDFCVKALGSDTVRRAQKCQTPGSWLHVCFQTSALDVWPTRDAVPGMLDKHGQRTEPWATSQEKHGVLLGPPVSTTQLCDHGQPAPASFSSSACACCGVRGCLRSVS